MKTPAFAFLALAISSCPSLAQNAEPCGMDKAKLAEIDTRITTLIGDRNVARESEQTLVGFLRGETMNVYAGSIGL